MIVSLQLLVLCVLFVQNVALDSQLVISLNKLEVLIAS